MPTVSKTVNVSTILRYSADFAASYKWQPVSVYQHDIGQSFSVFGRNNISPPYNASCIPLPAFAFDGTASKLSLSFSCQNTEAHTYRWALCTSNANKASYEGTSSAVSDNTQVAQGTFSLGAIGTSNTTVNLDVAVPSGVPLYVFLWSYESGGSAAHINAGSVTAVVTYTEAIHGIAHIDNGAAWQNYTIWIDNGTAWQQYEAYVDTGSGWALLT